MPRTADHESRRLQVADALLRVIVRGGLAEASLAEVATEAGVSIGLIQRYFTTKDQLLAFAFSYLLDRAHERIEAARPTQPEPTKDTAYRMLESMLPLDDERFGESVVWVAFLAGTLPTPDGLAPHVSAMRRMHEVIAAVTSPVEAVLLTSTVDGLILGMVTNPADVTHKAAKTCLRLAVDRAFGGLA